MSGELSKPSRGSDSFLASHTMRTHDCYYRGPHSDARCGCGRRSSGGGPGWEGWPASQAAGDRQQCNGLKGGASNMGLCRGKGGGLRIIMPQTGESWNLRAIVGAERWGSVVLLARGVVAGGAGGRAPTPAGQAQTRARLAQRAGRHSATSCRCAQPSRWAFRGRPRGAGCVLPGAPGPARPARHRRRRSSPQGRTWRSCGPTSGAAG